MSRAALALHVVGLATVAVRIKQQTDSRELRRAVCREVHVKQFNNTEKNLIKELSPFFKSQIDSAVEQLKSTTDIDSVFDPKEWNKELVDITLPVLAKSMSQAAIAQMLVMGIDLRKAKLSHSKSTASEWLMQEGDDPPPGVITDMPQWMKDAISSQLREGFSQDYWEGINETTKDDIESFLRSGLTDGESIREMSARIKDSLGTEYYKRRAENIARTESGNALNGARRAAIDGLINEVGPQVPITVSWLSVLGNTTRDDHANLDGVPADDDGLWNLAGYKVPWPGHYSLPPAQRCNCMCSLNSEFGMDQDEANRLIQEHFARTNE